LMLSLAPAPVKARQIIRKPLNGRRLVFTPAPHRRLYTFTGKASYGRVLEDVVQNVWRPRGDSIREHLHDASSSEAK